MSYIRIANKAESVNRLYLEKLGLSTKRDNEDTIGQFGSGSKFAPIAALRNGWEWINVGSDDLGDYKMQYVSQVDQGIDCIYYLYNDEVMKPSSFTVDAGVLSWDSTFQIFREAFANALDEFLAFGSEYTIDVVDEVKHEPGVFAVYLTADPLLLAIIEDFDKYFSIKRKPLIEFHRGIKLYKPFDTEPNFYYKGVLVHTDTQTDALPMFDYEMNNIVLNEERRVRDTWSLATKVTLAFNLLNEHEDGLDIARMIIRNANKNRWEWTIGDHHVASYFWKTTNCNFVKAWNDIHGDAVAITSDMMRYRGQFALRNLEVVEVKSTYLYAILNACGVPCGIDVLGDDVHYKFFDLSDDRQKMFDTACQIVVDYLPGFARYQHDIRVFIPQGEQDGILGVANMIEKKIYISINAFTSLESLVGTLVHEYDHLDSGYGDDDTAFRGVADCHIGDLLVKMNGGLYD